jgi:hypothetical protein
MKATNNDTRETRRHIPLDKSKLSFSSEALLQQAIAGLLTRNPEISGVQILQGSQEVGKDIIFYLKGGFDEVFLCACVVKNTKISGSVDSSSGARTIMLQAEQAFDSNYIDNFGNNVRVERVYIITPYDLPPPTIASISGRLSERAGRVVFIGGSLLFDLFKKHWPDYFADEASIIEQHLQDTIDLYVKDTPLHSLAFQYTLGQVSKETLDIYIKQGFHRELSVYSVGTFLSSLPSPHVLNKKITNYEISRIHDQFAEFDRLLNYLVEWGYCSQSYEPNKLQSNLDQFIADLLAEWRKGVALDLNYKRASSDGAAVLLSNQIWLAARMKELVAERSSQVDYLKNKLDELARIVGRTRFEGVKSLSNKQFLAACCLNDCARAAPEKVFSEVGEMVKVGFPDDILDQWAKPLLIAGSPGYGKTSFCKWHALEDAKRLNLGKSDFIPVYFPLHLLATKQLGSFESVFLKAIGQSALVSSDRLNSSKVRLYLDGLDEIASTDRRREVMELVKVGAERYPHYRIVVTSRDYIYGKWLEWLPKIYLSEFEDDEIISFIDKWLGENTAVNQRFCTQLADVPSLHSLMRIPLLATLTVMVFRQTGRLPESKTKLYEIFIDLLSGGWDITKGVNRGSVFGQKLKVMILCSVARTLHKYRRRTFTETEIKKAIQTSAFSALTADWQSVSSELITDGLIIRSGGVLQFAHLSFQEFLAAKDLMGTPHHTRALRALEAFLCGDDWWKDVLKFYVALASSPSDIAGWLTAQIRHVKAINRSEFSAQRANELRASITDAFPEYSTDTAAPMT